MKKRKLSRRERISYWFWTFMVFFPVILLSALTIAIGGRAFNSDTQNFCYDLGLKHKITDGETSVKRFWCVDENNTYHQVNPCGWEPHEICWIKQEDEKHFGYPPKPWFHQMMYTQ